MKYACEAKYYDKGRVNATVYPVDDDQKKEQRDYANFDYYLDVFDTKKEALDFCATCK